MFGNLVVWYLYLGGAGGALVCLLSLADLLYRRAGRTGAPRLAWTGALRPRFFARGHTAAFAALALGALCLVADLGRPERFYYVFAFPTASVLTVGSVVLAAALTCAAYLAAVSVFRLSNVAPWTIRLAEWLGVACGLATTVYTGVLLAQIDAVALWNPALVALFACSSFCVATAVLTVCLFPVEEAPRQLLDVLARTDLALVALEAASFAVYLAAAAATNPGLIGSMVWGEAGVALWAGFAVPGLVVPAALGAAYQRTGARGLVGACVPFVLVGGFFLRYCVVNAPLF